jgi:hypothetical protein
MRSITPNDVEFQAEFEASSSSYNLRATARLYHGYEINLVPIGSDKNPVVLDAGYCYPWGIWNGRRQTAADVERLPWKNATGLAAVCGPISRLACVDFDNQPDQQAVMEFVSSQGLTQDYLWVSQTPGGGFHVFVFVEDELDLAGRGKLDREGKYGGHIELRYDGHLVIIPPSIHPTGNRYAFLHGPMPDQPPAVVPAKTLLAGYNAVTLPPPQKDRHTSSPPAFSREPGGIVPPVYALTALHHEVDAVRSASPGTRNDQLNRSAFSLGQLVASGLLDHTEVEHALTEAAQAAGLPLHETRATIRSGMQAGLAQPRQIPERIEFQHGGHQHVSDPDRPDASHTIAASTAPDTRPYAVDPAGRMVLIKEGKNGQVAIEPIADFNVRIAREIVEEDGRKVFELRGKTIFNSEIRAEIPAADFEDTRKLKACLSTAADARATMHAGKEKHLPPAIRKLTGDVERIRKYTRTGWHEGTFLIPGREAPGVVITPYNQAPYRLDPDADVTVALTALEYLIRALDPKQATPIITVVFQAPMAEPARMRNERYGLAIQGLTGKFKTTSAQLGLSFYGAEFAHNDGYLLKWGEGGTHNAIMAHATCASDLPMLIDNFKPNTGGGTSALIALIHNILEGGEKARLNRDATLKASRPIHTWPIITGEDIPEKDAASLARILVVRFEDQPDNASQLLSVAQRDADQLNALGRVWIDFLESEEGRRIIQSIRTQFEPLRDRYMDQLKAVRRDVVNLRRIATNLATNHLTWMVLQQHPQIGPLLREYDDAYLERLDRIMHNMADTTAESREAVRFLAAIRQLLVSKRCVLANRDGSGYNLDTERDRLIGYRDTDGSVYLIPDVARREVERLLGHDALGGLSPNALHQQLDDLGWIASRNTDGFRKTVRVGRTKEPASLLHLTAEALTDPE